jgi:hypothetical protein
MTVEEITTVDAPTVLFGGAALRGDDYQLEYDSGGYPELPACLDRRKPRLSK